MIYKKETQAEARMTESATEQASESAIEKTTAAKKKAAAKAARAAKVAEKKAANAAKKAQANAMVRCKPLRSISKNTADAKQMAAAIAVAKNAAGLNHPQRCQATHSEASQSRQRKRHLYAPTGNAGEQNHA